MRTQAQRRAFSLAVPSAAIDYGQFRRPRRLRGYRDVRFPLPFTGLGCAGCKRPTLGANIVTLTWTNGQVLNFDLDVPAQKAQHDAIKSYLASLGTQIEPTATIVYGGGALIPPQYSPGVLLTAGKPSPLPMPSMQVAEVPWLDQQMISGVPNKWLAAGALGFVALASLRKGGRR